MGDKSGEPCALAFALRAARRREFRSSWLAHYNFTHYTAASAKSRPDPTDNIVPELHFERLTDASFLRPVAQPPVFAQSVELA
jgi:hypothetical protein